MWPQFDYRTAAEWQEQRLKEAAHARLVRSVMQACAGKRTQRGATLVKHRLGVTLEALGRQLQSLPPTDDGYSAHELSR